MKKILAITALAMCFALPAQAKTHYGDIKVTGTIYTDEIAEYTGSNGVAISNDTDITGDLTVSGAVEAASVTVTPSATPTYSAIDSDTTDGDVSTQIVTNCTDTGSGTEDCDMTMSQQVAGTMTAVITANADGTNSDRLTVPDNSIGADELTDWYGYDSIPVAWMKDGTNAPADLDDASTRSPYAYRDFDATADEDLDFVWFVPSDLSGSTIQYRVKYLVTNATGPSATEGVAFSMAGASVGDNDASNPTLGTAVVITDDTLNAAQHDVLITGWSGDVTITGLAAGEVAEMNILRDISDTVDNYAQDVGVFMVEIRYVRNVGR